MHGLNRFASIAALAVAGSAAAAFTGYSTVRTESGSLVKYELYGNFSGPTDTVLNAFHCSLVSGGVMFHHADALNGGVDSTVAGTWNPQFVLVPGAMDSYVCIGGGEGFASGNSTAADPDWGAAGFNTAQIPYGNGETSGPGWFNQNPPNLQGRVNAQGQVKIGQFVIALADDASQTVIRLKMGFNDGIPGSGVQFADSNFIIGGGGSFVDCNGNGVPDSVELDSDPSIDCDGNGLIDSCQVAGGSDDTNGNGVVDSCELARGDLNLDGVVNASDMPFFLNAWGSGGPIGDLNFDGIVDGGDFSILLGNWGTTP